MEHNKLVRDLIPDIIRDNGTIPVTHVATDSEYAHALRQKLHEEVEEFLAQPSVEEYADIVEVIHAICDNEKVDIKNIDDVRKQKRDIRGGFSKRIILEKTEEV